MRGAGWSWIGQPPSMALAGFELSLESRGCYTFAAWRTGFRVRRSFRVNASESRVHDPIAAGRRAALRAVAIQAGTVALVAAAFLTQGPADALAALLGGWSLAAGNGVSALLSLHGIVPAGVALARLVLGTLAKWCVTLAVLALALAAWHLPPLPLLVGLAAGLAAYLAALYLLPARGTSSGAAGR